MKVSNILSLPFVFVLFIISSTGISHAAQTKGFSGNDVKTLLPVLKRHDTIGFTEFNKNGSPKAISLATRIHANTDTVFNIFKDPDNFYYISTLFKENKIIDQTDNMILWSWASRHSFFTITGKNSITLYPPRRVDVKVLESSLGAASFTLRFYKDGKDYTILTISGFLNVKSSQWLIRMIIGNSSSMIQAFNIAVGFFVIKGIKTLTENIEKGKSKRKHTTRGKAGGIPSLLNKSDIANLTPFLKKGQVFLCDSHNGGRLKQATVLERVKSNAGNFTKTVKNPYNYAKKISAINNIKIEPSTSTLQPAKEKMFSWNMGFAIFQLSSLNRISDINQGVLLESINGDFKGAKWRWQIIPETANTSIIAYHAYADVAAMSPILESTIKREPYLEHGLVMGSNIVMLKAMALISAKGN